MRRLIRKSQCRVCKEWFSRIMGLVTHDNLSCSEKCFIQVPVNQLRSQNNYVATKEELNKRKKSKSKRRNRTSFHKSDEWLKLRYEVLKKYGRKCMLCGTEKGEMNVDHIKPRSKYPNLVFEFNNLQVLCRDCNVGKSDRDDTDFRSHEDILK